MIEAMCPLEVHIKKSECEIENCFYILVIPSKLLDCTHVSSRYSLVSTGVMYLEIQLHPEYI
jgi:hypothetical protein